MQSSSLHNNKQHLLSFVIPTLFRENELEECLASLLSQVSDSYFDVVIVSPVSFATADRLLARYRNLGLDIKFYSPRGTSSIASDLLMGIQCATGRYCWLLSDDDIVQPGSIGFIHNVLMHDDNLGGISVGYLGYTKNLKNEINNLNNELNNLNSIIVTQKEKINELDINV